MKKKEITIEDLAGMMKRGFDEMGGEFSKINNRFQQVDKRFEQVDKRLGNLERGQEGIKLQLGEAAWRFEVKNLEKRVDILETKAARSWK